MPHTPRRSYSRSSHRIARRATHDYDAYASVATGRDEAVAQEQVDGVLGPGAIPPGTLTTAAFASTIRPVAIVAALPSLPHPDYPLLSYAVLTTDSRLYKNIGDVWVLGVDGADIVADSITAGKIAAGAIGTSELAVGARLTGEVANEAGGTPGVFIDSTGILVRNGKLTLQDEFGSTSMAASGFAGSWHEFISLGLYNARFLQGSGGTGIALGRTAAMPYWTLSQVVGTPTFDHVVNSGLRLNFPALNDSGRVVSDAVPVRPSVDYQVPFTVNYSVSIGNTIELSVVFEWYKSDMTASSTPTSTCLFLGASVSFSSLATQTSFQFDPVESPSDARFVKLRVTLTKILHSSPGSCSMTLQSFGVREAAAENMFNLDLKVQSLKNELDEPYEPAIAYTMAAYPPGVNNTTDFSGSVLNLATVAAGVGGAFALAVSVPGPMWAENVVIWNTDVSLARSAEVGVYYAAGGLGNLVRVASGTTSFTPTAAGKVVVSLGGPVYLRPGTYFIVIRNTSTARTFGLGGTANGPTNLTVLGRSNASQAALGASLDISAWAATGSARGLGLEATGW